MKPAFAIPRSLFAPLLLAFLAAWLAGCRPEDEDDSDFHESPALQAPPIARRPVTADTYTVVRGDTLYSLSFKRGLDYRDVAAWNGISGPDYTIRVGQTLRFAPANASASSTLASSGVTSVAAMPSTAANTLPPPRPSASSGGMFEDVPAAPMPANEARPAPSPPNPIAAPAPHPAPAPAGATPTATAPTTVPAVPPTTAPPAATPPPSKPSAPAPAPAIADSTVVSNAGISWRWPSAGKVVGTFVGGDQTKQGIDIAGNAGDPVLASAEGEVVYSGNGLLGYGELIIVKHNASFLSAYGHNRKRLVNEGDKVHAGQQIAEMGSSASSRDELHFEIRKNGKPVNPLEYLPAH